MLYVTEYINVAPVYVSLWRWARKLAVSSVKAGWYLIALCSMNEDWNGDWNKILMFIFERLRGCVNIFPLALDGKITSGFV